MVRQDWEHASFDYQQRLDENPEAIFPIAKAFRELPPVYLKCLFSFAFFAVSLEDAYEALRADINKLNEASCFRITPPSKPKKNPYLRKVRRIRNNVIAHINSTKLDDFESFVAQTWDVGWSKQEADHWHVDKLNFKSWKYVRKDQDGSLIRESEDYEVSGFMEFYDECMNHFIEEDAYCCGFLDALVAKLPTQDADFQYIAYSLPS